MKVAFVCHPGVELIPPAKGQSINIWTFQVARRLAANHTVLVYSQRSGNGSGGTTAHEGVEYVYVSGRVCSLYNRAERRITGALERLRLKREDPITFASSRRGLAYALAVAWDVRRRRCDVVHVHNFSQLVPVIRRLNPHAKIVLHMHCDWLSQLDPSVIGPRVEQADLVVGCSHHVVDGVRQCYPLHRDKCRTVYNGVDPRSFTRDEVPKLVGYDAAESFRLLFVSRVSPEKGVHVLLDAMLHLRQVVPNVHLHVVGSHGQVPYPYIVGVSQDTHVRGLSRFYTQGGHRGVYRQYLEQQVREAGLARHVSFLGSIPYQEMVSYYQKADVLVAPSLSEAFGMSLVEAMASEVPVVAAQAGGMPEVVEHDVTGLIVPPNDPQALADALYKLYKDPNRRAQMGRAGRDRVQALFSWEAVLEGLTETYGFSGSTAKHALEQEAPN